MLGVNEGDESVFNIALELVDAAARRARALYAMTGRVDEYEVWDAMWSGIGELQAHPHRHSLHSNSVRVRTLWRTSCCRGRPMRESGPFDGSVA